MVFDFLKGEFIDVISWLDDTRDTMVWRFDRRGQAIKYGAKLTVREGQSAVFIHEGQLADVFGPGLYMLETNNMPIMTTLQHWDHLFDSPFKSEVYFINTTRFNDLKWGTKNPIMTRDPEFGPVRIRAFGTYSMRVTDPGKFMTEIVGTDGEFTADEISFQLRNVILQEMSRTLAKSDIAVLDMAANTADLAKTVNDGIAAQIAEYGIELPELYIENISLPEEVEKVLDKRTSVAVAGDLDAFTKFSAAEALDNPDGAAGGALAAGVGAAMGLGMAQNMGLGAAKPAAEPKAAEPAPAKEATVVAVAPPPPPPSKLWHLAVNGETKGPYTEAELTTMAEAKDLTAASLVWTPGQDGWKAVSDTDLAQLLARLPPPPPAG
jgi:membrane protease subunit (stomatin/prohibitin family)